MTVGKYYDMPDDPVVDALIRMPTATDVPYDHRSSTAGSTSTQGRHSGIKVSEITLRDLFALGCMMAHVNARRDYAPANDAAPWYYKMADDMMKARL